MEQSNERLESALKNAHSAGDEEAARALANEIKRRRRAGEKNSVRKQTLPERLSNAATLNFGDEIAAGVVAGGVGGVLGAVDAVRERDISAIPERIGKEFSSIRASQAASEDRFLKENPGQALAADVVGGAIGAGKFAPALKGLGVVGTGAVEGGVFAAGNARGGVTDRADDAALGAALGAGGAKLFQGIANKARQWWSARGQSGARFASKDTKSAFEALGKVVEQDLGSRGRAEAFLRRWFKSGAQPDEIFRVGPTTRYLMEIIADRHPKRAIQFATEIRDTAKNRVLGKVGQKLNSKGRKFRASSAALKALRQTEADPLYRAAEQVEIPQAVYLEKILPELQSDAAKKAIGHGIPLVDAQKDFATKELLKNARKDPRSVVLSTKALDQIKQGYDAQIEVAFKNGNSRRGFALKEAKRALTSAMDEVNPKYAEARRVFGDISEIDDALHEGKKFLRQEVREEDVRILIDAMGPSEREFYRVSIAEEIVDQMERAVGKQDKIRQFTSIKFQKKIRAAFADSPQDADDLITVIKKAEDDFVSITDVDPQNGSQTARKRQAQEAFDDAITGPVQKVLDHAPDSITKIPASVKRIGSERVRQEKAARVSDILSEALFGDGTLLQPSPSGPPAPQIHSATAVVSTAQNSE